MEHIVGGAKAGGGLGNLVDGFLDRVRVAEQMGEGMVAVGAAPGPNAAMMGRTMLGEGAAQLGAFGMLAGPRLDVNDFLASSARHSAEEARAMAQMDGVMAAMRASTGGGPSVDEFLALQGAMQGPSVADFAAFQAMQGPSVDEFAAFQAMQGPSMADFAAFQLAQGPSAIDFAMFQAMQRPSMADFVAFQEMAAFAEHADLVANFAAFQQMQPGPSAADFAAFQMQQGPSAADFAAFEQSQGLSIADFEAFQAAQGPSVADFQAFQRSQGPSVADFQAFQQQVSATEERVVQAVTADDDSSDSEVTWNAALADALSAESLGLSDSEQPLATMCAAGQVPMQLVTLEAKLRLTRHHESGMEAEVRKRGLRFRPLFHLCIKTDQFASQDRLGTNNVATQNLTLLLAGDPLAAPAGDRSENVFLRCHSYTTKNRTFICQDRLGTNTGTAVETESTVFCRSAGADELSRAVAGAPAAGARLLDHAPHRAAAAGQHRPRVAAAVPPTRRRRRRRRRRGNSH